MNRIKTLITALFLAAFVLSANTLINAQAGPAPTPKPLPPGMKGSDANDPRAKLKAGLFDAGEAAVGMKHISLTKKPPSFDLGVDPASPKVASALSSLGIGNPNQLPENMRMTIAGLALANSDLAFQGKYLFLGNFYGMNIYDISKPAAPALVTSMLCPGGQGDVSVYKNLMFMSVEMPNGRVDCGEQGFPAGEPGKGPAASKDRFRGVRIFDISDIKNPKQVGGVQTCRGSHTHTLVTDPNDKENVYIYVSGTSFVRQPEELEGCSGGAPDKDPNTALFRIEVIKVPVAAPQNAKIVNSPRVFGDAASGKINALDNGGSHDGNGRPQETNQCHDITAYSQIGLAAGACAGNGILLDIKDPANPKRVEAVNDPNYAYWHSAAFSNDGKKVVFTDEWGGGMGPRCRETDPNKWGADAIFTLDGTKLTFKNYYKLPAAQTEQENCVAHNGSLIPVPGRDIKVQAWYQGGISIVDFTDPSKPMEIAYFDRGPIDPNILVMGGSWSAYWYNGHIYSSEIARGLDVFELTPTKYLSANEIKAAKSVKVSELNVQNQQRFVWNDKAAVAQAYVDQLERANTLTAVQAKDLRKSIAKAESSKMSAKSVADLKVLVEGLEKKVADSTRLQELLAVFE
jgi:hypothetical protein